MQHYAGDLMNQDSQLEQKNLLDKKVLHFILFNKVARVEPSRHMRTILHTWTDKASIQSKQLEERAKWAQTP